MEMIDITDPKRFKEWMKRENEKQIAYIEKLSKADTEPELKTASASAEAPASVDEPQHPDYYKSSVNPSLEVFDMIDGFVGADFYLGNVLKYVCRAGKKSGESRVKDLNKALHYIKEAIKRSH